MKEKECVCNIKFESCYIERKEHHEIKITFRTMVWHLGFKQKIELFLMWLKLFYKGAERVSFKTFLDTERPFEYDEPLFIEVSNKTT